MKKFFLIACGLAMALTASADYYLTGENINFGAHWSANYKKFEQTGNTYTMHLDHLGTSFKITTGSWGSDNEFAAWDDDSRIAVGYAYDLKKGGSNLYTVNDEHYTNVDLTLVDNGDGNLSLTIQGDECYSLIGSNVNGSSKFDLNDFGYAVFKRQADDTYLLHLDQLGNNFKIIVKKDWSTSIGRKNDGDKLQLGVPMAVRGNDGGNVIFDDASITYKGVDLVLDARDKDNMTLTMTAAGRMSDWYLIGDMEGNWSLGEAKCFDEVAPGEFVLNVDTLSKSFKVIKGRSWDTQIGFADQVNKDNGLALGAVANLSVGGGDIYAYRYGLTYETCHRMKDVKVIFKDLGEGAYTLQLIPQSWYLVGELNSWDVANPIAMDYNGFSGCYEYEAENIPTNFKLLNDKQWQSGEWGATVNAVLDTPLQLISNGSDNNINFAYIGAINGKLSLNPENFTLTASGIVLSHNYPELALVGSLTGVDDADWAKSDDSIVALTVDEQTGVYTSEAFAFPESYEFKIKEGANNEWDGARQWGGADAYSYNQHTGYMAANGDNVVSTIGGHYAVKFDIHSGELTFVEDYDFQLFDIGFYNHDNKIYMTYTIDHNGGSGVKHYLIEVYEVSLEEIMTLSEENIIGSVEHSDFSVPNGVVELTGVEGSGSLFFMVRATAVKHYGVESVPSLNP